MDVDTIVVGGGLVGAATVYGLTQQRSDTALAARLLREGFLPGETVVIRAERFDVQDSTAT